MDAKERKIGYAVDMVDWEFHIWSYPSINIPVYLIYSMCASKKLDTHTYHRKYIRILSSATAREEKGRIPPTFWGQPYIRHFGPTHYTPKRWSWWFPSPYRYQLRFRSNWCRKRRLEEMEESRTVYKFTSMIGRGQLTVQAAADIARGVVSSLNWFASFLLWYLWLVTVGYCWFWFVIGGCGCIAGWIMKWWVDGWGDGL